MLTASGSTSSQSAKRTLAPAPGVTPPPTDGSSYRFLSDVIIARGLVDPAAMKAALQASLAGRSLTQILVDNGELSEDDLARTLAEHHRLDFIDLDVFAVDPRATALVEPDVARRFGAVPIALLPSGAVVAALYDPNGSTAVLEFARITDRVIQPAVASRRQIEALIASLRRDSHAPPPPPPPPPPHAPAALHAPPAPAPPAPRMASPDMHAPEQHPRSVPTPDTGVREGVDPAQYPRSAPAAPAAAVLSDGERAELDSRADALRERAEAAERRRYDADERARAAEERAREAEERVRAAEELTRLAEARAHASEERALAAGELVDAAEARADGMSSAADAANATLARLVRACELLEREAETRGPEMEVLREALDTERGQRARLETQLRDVQSSEEMVALQVRIAELERQLDERQAAPPEPPPTRSFAPPAQAYAPPPAPPKPTYAPPPARAAPPEQAYAPPPAPAAPPEQAYAPPPAPAAPPEPAYAPPAPADPAPQPPPVAEPQTEVVVPDYIPPSIAPTIDIIGEPGVPYVSALAPMPSHDAPVKKVPKSTTAKARGLRRLISAIKRSA